MAPRAIRYSTSRVRPDPLAPGMRGAELISPMTACARVRSSATLPDGAAAEITSTQIST
jgi:hypothetical protein